MRVLLYNPGYTVDKDGQSLRITQLSSALAPNWQFDIVTTPVFFSHHQSVWTEPSQVHYEFPHLRVFLTNPAAIAALRAKLHRSGGRRGPVALVPGVNEQGSLRRPSFARYVLRGLNRRYNQVFGRIGDPDWVLPAVLQGLRLLTSRSYECICSSASSYFASHIAAAIVSTIGRLPLVVDYGDPWSPEPPARSRVLDTVSEAFVLRRTGRVIVTNERARRALLSRYSFLRHDRISVIPQGYADSSKGDGPPASDGEAFTIVYTGNLYAGFQSALEFLKAVRAARSHGISVKVEWAGSGLPGGEAERTNRMDRDLVIRDLGRLPHHEALALQRRATLLLVIGTRSHSQIPGKTIEYIGAGRPILCLSEGPSDLAAEFVKEHGLGVVVPNRADDILEVLGKLHALWLNGQLGAIYRPVNVERFSWPSLARDLEGVLLDVVAQNMPGSEIPRRAGDERGEDPKSGKMLLTGPRKG